MAHDVIIVGGGSAGCILANRLSASGELRVLLLENGPDDLGLKVRTLVDMPKGLARLLADPRYAYHYPDDTHAHFANGRPPDVQMRGRLLGGSSAVNGLVYHRGQPQDYDGWGLAGWSWAEMLPAFLELERHSLPATAWRGRKGAIPITLPPARGRLARAMFAAAEGMGLRRNEEPNLPDHRGVSPVASNIDRRGRRVSAARGFLTPAVRRRPNLTILTDTHVDRLIFEDGRAVGVEARRGRRTEAFAAAREVIVCAGAIASPALLQRSGLGPAALLDEAGVPLVRDLPGVGANLADHWNYYAAYELKHAGDSLNRQFRGWRLVRNTLQYGLFGTGSMASGSHQIVAFVETEPGQGRADVEMLFSPYTYDADPQGGSIAPAAGPTMHLYATVARPTSRGRIAIRSADPDAPPRISSNYLATEHDRRIVVRAGRFIRQWVARPEVAPLIARELPPTAGAETDAEFLAAARMGGSGLHAVGTCRMGLAGDPMAVTDTRLRVHGIEGLRVVDCSVIPEPVSANTNGTVMAVALRASKLILEDLARA